MSNIQPYNNYISAVNENLELTTELIAQLKKDFGTLLMVDPVFNQEFTTYDNLYQWIFPVLKNLFDENRQKFTSLIYVIDAGFIKQKFGKRPETELEQWTHAILLRECLKVFIRKNYQPHA